MKQDDSNYDTIARKVAGQIIADYTGLTIGSEDQPVTNDQLEARIVRALCAFHRREGHLEPRTDDVTQSRGG